MPSWVSFPTLRLGCLASGRLRSRTHSSWASRKRSTQADAQKWLPFLNSLGINIDGETAARALSDILAPAHAQSLSAYDAAYLELALRKGLPLATLDNKLKTAAAVFGVPLYQVRP